MKKTKEPSPFRAESMSGVFLVILFVVMSLIEHKQRMEALEFKERLYRLRQQFLDDYTNDKQGDDS